MLLSIDFGRFMTSEGTDALILTLTSKTGQYVARNTHIIILFGFLYQLFGFLYQREDEFRHFIGIITDSRRRGLSR